MKASAAANGQLLSPENARMKPTSKI